MKYNFDEVIDRRGTYSAKWDALSMMKKAGMVNATIDDETIPMMTADMDLRTAQPILDALHKTVDQKMFGYTMPIAGPEYAQAVCRWFKVHHDWEITPDEVFFSNGTFDALGVAVNAFSNENNGIIICRPVYGHFTQAIVDDWHRKPVSSHLIADENGYYTINFEDLEEKCADPNNKILIWCSPANPIGRVWTVEELQKVAAICKKHDVLVLSDEVHCDLLRKGVKHHPFSSIVEDKSNIIVLTAINKSFNLAGLACSNAIIEDPELRAKFSKAYGMRMANPFSIQALIAAYNEGDEWMDQVNEYIDGNIDWLIDFLHKEMPKVKVWRPEGTYTLWLDFRAYGLSDEEVHDRIYNKAKVLLQDGLVHDPDEGQCFQRVCVPCARSVLKTAFERIAAQFADCK